MDSESECLFDPSDIPPLPPPLLFNPLPLQCLAADALPMRLQQEIGDMLDIYADATAIEPPPEFNEKKDLTMSARPTEDSPPLQQAWSSDSLVPSPRHQMTFLLRRKQRSSSSQGNDFGVGLKIVGGVNCERCRNMHAMVTSVLPGTECAHTVREGMLVTEWCGKKLDGRSYEHVLWLMSSTEEEVVEIVVREPCGLVRPGSTTTFQLRMSGHSSHSSHSSLKGRLSVFLGTREVRPEDVDSSDTSNSSSRRESSTGTEEQLEGFFASLPSGMVKLSIQYSRIEEKLGVGLVQVKAQALEGHEEAAIFISVQMIPDERSQELKFAKLHGTPALFHLLPTELAVVALRVTLWESMDIKSAFRGEVLLRVLDKDTVTLNGDPSWYTVCSPDPNLPHLEDPFDYSKSRQVATAERKKGLGTCHTGQRRTLKTLFKKVSSSPSPEVHVVEATVAPPVMVERKTSLPAAKAPEVDGMKLVFATMMKKMKKKYHSETQFKSQSQLQPHSQSSTSLIQSPVPSPLQAARSQSPQAQVQSTLLQSPFRSVQPPSLTQFQLTQSRSHSKPTQSQSQCTTDPSPAIQPGNGGCEEEGDGEEGDLEKLASIISTLRRELSQLDEESRPIEALDTPPSPPSGDDDDGTPPMARVIGESIPPKEGCIGEDPLHQVRGQPTPAAIDTDVMVGRNDPNISAWSGRSLLSSGGTCSHEDIEVCLLDAKKWSEGGGLGFSPNLSPADRDLATVTTLTVVGIDEDECSYQCRIPTSTPVLRRGECPGLLPTPITASSPSSSCTSSPHTSHLPPSPHPPSPHTPSLHPPSPHPPSPHPPSPHPPSPHPPSPHPPSLHPPTPHPPSPHPPSPHPLSPHATPSVASSKTVAATAVRGNVSQQVGSVSRSNPATEKEDARPLQERHHVVTHHSGKGTRLLVPLPDSRTASDSRGGSTSVPKRSNLLQKQTDGLHTGDEGGSVAAPAPLPSPGLTSAEQQPSMRHLTPTTSSTPTSSTPTSSTPTSSTPTSSTPTSSTPTSSTPTIITITPSPRPVHFQTKHRSRSLNDILSSSGEDSSVSIASHCTVGVAPSRDVGATTTTTTTTAAATSGHVQDKPVANDTGSLGHKARGSGSKMVALGALSKQSRKEKASQVIGKRHHTRRSSLSALSPRSQNPPPSGDAATPPTPQPWLLMAGGVASAHTKGNSWYSNLFGRKKGRSQEERADRPRPLGELQKSKSTENVLGQEQDPQRPHDQRRRGSHASIHPMVEPKKPEDRVERGLPLGSIQLSFSYSAQTPALQVTLTDMVMLSSKGLFSDFKLKMRVLHTSSGVCLMKHKTSLSYKRGMVKPNAEFQFFVEVQNLTLQVLISVPGTHMFSRKSYMEAWIDLNQLGLAENRALSKWFEVQKQTTF